MRTQLTPAVERALQAAQGWARSEGAAEVEPRHVLLGLLQEEEGRAADLLRQAGLDPVAARAELAAGQLPPSTGEEPPALPQAAAVQEALREARLLAAEIVFDNTVTSECLLAAVLAREEPLRAALEGRGLDWERFEVLIQGEKKPPIALDEPLYLSEATEKIDTARILDAAANRAREALRVLEDHARFVLDDAFLSGELKHLRHDLAAALGSLPPSWLLEARETRRDVGTDLSTDAEKVRYAIAEVVQANCKRLQEALRSLEEFAKLVGPDLGEALERLRYRSYTLERALLLGQSARQRLAAARLYVLLTRAQCPAAVDWTIAEAAAGGAHVVQLREKTRPDAELLSLAREVRRLTRQHGLLFIMNDRPDVARLVEADGVHLGQDDLPVKEARRIVGPDALIGVSTHSLEQLRQAVLDGASYVGVGPTFPSGTKTFEEFPGLDYVRQAAAETSLPAFVIGGVSAATVGAAVAAGAKRVAVSQAVCAADDPRAAAAALLAALPPLPEPR